MAERQQVMSISFTETALVAGNPGVALLSNKLGWRTETVVRKTKEALPQVFEQNVYLALTTDLPITVYPDTFRKIFLYFTNSRWLSLGDLDDREFGPNLYTNRAERIIDCVYMTLALQEKKLSWLAAAHLVQAYGEDAEEIVDMVDDCLDYIMDVRRMNMPHPKARSVIINVIADHAANSANDGAVPNIVTAEDIIRLMSCGIPFDEDMEDAEDKERE